MSSNNSAATASGERVRQLLGLFVKDRELVDFCSRNQNRMVDVKLRIKEHVPEVTVEDIQSALKEYVARRTPPELSRRPDTELENLRAGLQTGLLEVVKQIDRGYRITMWMYTVAFVVGLSMLVVSTVAALLREVNSAALLGGLGAIDIITFLVFKPAQDLQASRGGLAQLQAAFFAWINDIHNWNEYLDLLQNECGSGAPPFEICKQISDIQGRSTEQMARLIAADTQFAAEIRKPPRESRIRKTSSSGREAPTAPD